MCRSLPVNKGLQVSGRLQVEGAGRLAGPCGAPGDITGAWRGVGTMTGPVASPA